MSTQNTLPRHARLFIQSAWEDGASTSKLVDKYNGDELAAVHEASDAQVDRALSGLVDAHQRINFPPYRRAEILLHAAQLITDRYRMFTESVIADSGFTRRDAEREVSRAIDTLTISGEEARRIHGEVIPIDGYAAGTGRTAFTLRTPVGVVCAITPFNSPLNTVVHKVGPALAAGNAVILKPALATPLSAVLLVKVLVEAGLPPELIALVHGGGSTVGERLLQSRFPAFYAFTGSTAVGAHIRRTVGLRKTQLELGSLSSTIICSDADMDTAAKLVVNAGFRKAGQVCTSVQRLYVAEDVSREFEQRIAELLVEQPVGNPWAPETFVGPLIDPDQAKRVEEWIHNATNSGAEVLAGGVRNGAVIAPTVLGNVAPTSEVFSEEIFGPVVVTRPFSDLDEAIAEINATPYGLAAGIFTNRIDSAITAAQRLHMGSVHINQTSSNRVDAMPYTGVKESGTGTEGPRYAIQEMTDQRLITFGQ